MTQPSELILQSRFIQAVTHFGTAGSSYVPTACIWLVHSGLWAAPATRALVQGDYVSAAFMGAASVASAAAAIPKIGARTIRTVQSMMANI